MRPLLKALAKFCRLSLLNTLYLRSRREGAAPKIEVGRSVFCYAHPSSTITGPGSLHLGATWDHSRTLPSEFRMLPGSKLQLQGNATILTGCSINIQAHATLTLGRGGYINVGARIDCWKSISIGDGTVIGPDVVIYDNDCHCMGSADFGGQAITIGNHVWIGTRVVILKGVTIGDSAVIAAGSVVVKDIPPGCLAAGVPAKVIRQGVEWS